MKFEIIYTQCAVFWGFFKLQYVLEFSIGHYKLKNHIEIKFSFRLIIPKYQDLIKNISTIPKTSC